MRKDAQANQQKILTTAQQLFDQSTVAAVSMQDIAQAAGIGAGTLYRHYRNKSALCLALVTDRIASFIVASNQYLTTAPSDGARVFDHVIGAYLQLRETNMALLASVEAGEPGRLDFYQSELYRNLEGLFQQVLGRLTPTLTTDERVFRADMLIAMLKSTSYAFQRHERGRTQPAILQLLRQLLT